MYPPRKMTFLHPYSALNWYRRTSKGDSKGKSLKTSSFVVPIHELDRRLNSVIKAKMGELLKIDPNDSENIEKIKKHLDDRFINNLTDDQRERHADLDQKIQHRLMTMTLEEKEKLLSLLDKKKL